MAISIISKVIKTALTIYAAAYLGLSGNALYDNYTSNSQCLLVENKLTLNVKHFRANFGGVEKHITLVGETHLYNKKDYEKALELLQQHDSFASEYGDGKAYFQDRSWATFITDQAIFIPCAVPFAFLSLAQGRHYDSVSRIAVENGKHVYTLERRDDVYAHLSLQDKIAFFSVCTTGALLGPLVYYSAKEELPERSVSSFPLQEGLVDKRNPGMGDSLIELLQRPDVDNLLVNVGNGHFKGVLDYVSNRIALEEITDYAPHRIVNTSP